MKSPCEMLFCKVDDISRFPYHKQLYDQMSKSRDFNSFMIYDFKAVKPDRSAIMLQDKKLYQNREELLARREELLGPPGKTVVFYAMYAEAE